MGIVDRVKGWFSGAKAVSGGATIRRPPLTQEKLERHYKRVAKVTGADPNTSVRVQPANLGAMGVVRGGKDPHIAVDPESIRGGDTHTSAVLAHEGSHYHDPAIGRMDRMNSALKRAEHAEMDARGNNDISDAQFKALGDRKKRIRKLLFRLSNRTETRATAHELNKKIPLDKGRNKGIMHRHARSSNKDVWDPRRSSYDVATPENKAEFDRRQANFEKAGGFSAEGIKNKAWLKFSADGRRGNLLEASRFGNEIRKVYSGASTLSQTAQNKLKKLSRGRLWGPKGYSEFTQGWLADNQGKMSPKELRKFRDRHLAHRRAHEKTIQGTPQEDLHVELGRQAHDAEKYKAQQFGPERKARRAKNKTEAVHAMTTTVPDKVAYKHAQRSGVGLSSMNNPGKAGVDEDYATAFSRPGRGRGRASWNVAQGHRHVYATNKLPVLAHEGVFKGSGHIAQYDQMVRPGATKKVVRPDVYRGKDPRIEKDAWDTGIKAAREEGMKFSNADARAANKAYASYTSDSRISSDKVRQKARRFFRRGGFRPQMGVPTMSTESAGKTGNLLEPAAVVKTGRQERLWKQAKKLARGRGHTKDWRYIMGIFKRSGGMKSREAHALSLVRRMNLRENLMEMIGASIPTRIIPATKYAGVKLRKVVSGNVVKLPHSGAKFSYPPDLQAGQADALYQSMIDMAHPRRSLRVMDRKLARADAPFELNNPEMRRAGNRRFRDAQMRARESGGGRLREAPAGVSLAGSISPLVKKMKLKKGALKVAETTMRKNALDRQLAAWQKARAPGATDSDLRAFQQTVSSTSQPFTPRPQVTQQQPMQQQVKREPAPKTFMSEDTPFSPYERAKQKGPNIQASDRSIVHRALREAIGGAIPTKIVMPKKHWGARKPSVKAVTTSMEKLRSDPEWANEPRRKGWTRPKGKIDKFKAEEDNAVDLAVSGLQSKRDAQYGSRGRSMWDFPNKVPGNAPEQAGLRREFRAGQLDERRRRGENVDMYSSRESAVARALLQEAKISLKPLPTRFMRTPKGARVTVTPHSHGWTSQPLTPARTYGWSEHVMRTTRVRRNKMPGDDALHGRSAGATKHEATRANVRDMAAKSSDPATRSEQIGQASNAMNAADERHLDRSDERALRRIFRGSHNSPNAATADWHNANVAKQKEFPELLKPPSPEAAKATPAMYRPLEPVKRPPSKYDKLSEELRRRGIRPDRVPPPYAGGGVGALAGMQSRHYYRSPRKPRE